MKTLLTGSRNVKAERYEQIKQVLGELKPKILLHGGAMGADTLGQKWADETGTETEVIRPDYTNHPPKLAPLHRNTELVNKADTVVVVWGEGKYHTGGTWDTMKKAKAKNLHIVELLPDGTRKEHPPQMTLF